ncbi:ribonuclease Y [Aerococcaceae bacterium zg-ZJ1578]|uniref:ribonuclease Y n=1 Tax=Aerococcaceae TaxID=186827 RepID=UPI0013BBDC51|nr:MULTISPECIES: ribonuclease Y [unclassified Facklamia]MBK0348804.1 ribonuclease Y [Aerococcaceae bacterium zg-1578]MBR7927150.1 ribonuclease Y [Aerococcaceae bacterium zg-ZUI334]QQD64701.1 ribonuclease Y [Aerococcaceae bacterium zg-252]NEW63522.1 ribonuclease Y [Facklamia sp. 252]NEW66993.1 ribonuclease Y [Facklamia sp. 253]
MDFMSYAFAIVTLIIGFVLGVFIQKKNDEKKVDGAKANAEAIVDAAILQAQTLKREALFDAKEENLKYRNEIEQELKERRNEANKLENRLIQKEENLDIKSNNLDKRELNLETKESEYTKRKEALETKEAQVQVLINEQQAELERVATLSRQEARDIIMTETEAELSSEIAVLVRNAEQKAKDEADRNAKSIILQAIQKSATDLVAENTVTVVHLPSDDMKGRIIGREGRNIRTLESLTGIDLIIDDTPETIVLSGFDPIRRQIAKIALEKLIQDGRIHPARIEEMVDRARKELDEKIREIGEEATFDVGIHSLHPDIIKILGRLSFRTSYGQNVLKHSIEVAKLAGVMASELGEDIAMAKRAGLLHDLGKALDHEIEGSHVEIGAEIANKYKEPEIVVNAIAAHHGDTDPTSVIAVLVAAADALSAARPGARSESLENYIRRLEKLEEISNSFDGVSHSFAIQAGREVRVMVKPQQLNDAQAAKVARDIRNRIESEMNYPGNIKVTVIRETRVVEYAK